MREPRDLKNYTTPEEAATFLEKLAKSIREDGPAGLMVKVNIQLNRWHHSWDTVLVWCCECHKPGEAPRKAVWPCICAHCGSDAGPREWLKLNGYKTPKLQVRV